MIVPQTIVSAGHRTREKYTPEGHTAAGCYASDVLANAHQRRQPKKWHLYAHGLLHTRRIDRLALSTTIALLDNELVYYGTSNEALLVP